MLLRVPRAVEERRAVRGAPSWTSTHCASSRPSRPERRSTPSDSFHTPTRRAWARRRACTRGPHARRRSHVPTRSRSGTPTRPPRSSSRRAPQPPQQAVPHLAMVHGAIYDAVNAIDGGHEGYLLTRALATPFDSKDAAAATAAYKVLLSIVPAQKADARRAVRGVAGPDSRRHGEDARHRGRRRGGGGDDRGAHRRRAVRRRSASRSAQARACGGPCCRRSSTTRTRGSRT